jgi:hypothetical protein
MKKLIIIFMKVNCEYRGFIINIYNDGSVEKIFRNL